MKTRLAVLNRFNLQARGSEDSPLGLISSKNMMGQSTDHSDG